MICWFNIIRVEIKIDEVILCNVENYGVIKVILEGYDVWTIKWRFVDQLGVKIELHCDLVIELLWDHREEIIHYTIF